MTILIVLPIQRSLEKRPHVDIEANSCSLLSCKCQLQLTLSALMDCGQCIVEFFGLFNHHHASCFSPLVFLLLRLFSPPPLPPHSSSTLNWLPINLLYSLLVYCKCFSFNQQVSTSLYFLVHIIFLLGGQQWGGKSQADSFRTVRLETVAKCCIDSPEWQILIPLEVFLQHKFPLSPTSQHTPPAAAGKNVLRNSNLDLIMWSLGSTKKGCQLFLGGLLSAQVKFSLKSSDLSFWGMIDAPLCWCGTGACG